MDITSILVLTDGCNIVDANIAVSSVLVVVVVSCNIESILVLVSNCNSELSKAAIRELLSIGDPIGKGYDNTATIVYSRLTTCKENNNANWHSISSTMIGLNNERQNSFYNNYLHAKIMFQ